VPIEEKTIYSVELVKEVATAPEIITEKDLVVYKTIEVKNAGTTEWPKGVYLLSSGSIKGDNIAL
jgi:hypothetical protein